MSKGDVVKKLIGLGLAMAAVMSSASANATAIGIKSITIQHFGAPAYLQVAEFRAFNTAGVNVASTANGALATASSQYASTGYLGQSGAGNAINGTIGGNYYSTASTGWIYHSATTSLSEFLTITFASVQDIQSVNIFGRTDCCAGRDIYKVTFKDSAGVAVGTLSNLSANNAAHVAIATAVPEPTTWASMLAGLGMIGFGMRRRKGGFAQVTAAAIR
jgi:hypothetical protein